MQRLLAILALLVFNGAAQAAGTLNRGNGGEPDTLDPAGASTTIEGNILYDLLMGLTTLDAQARPVPGAAERWEVSPDGKVWTFHLRPETWSDGVPVTANDFVFAWRRLLDPKTASQYAYNLWVVKNAHAVSEGKMPLTALGIAAKDASTLVVTLEHAAPYLPELLTHNTAMPLPAHVVAKRADWAKPGVFVGNGAFLLKSWAPNDHITLARNPRFYDAAHVTLDTVNYFPTTDSEAALRRYRAGELDVQSPVPLPEISWIRANLKGQMHVTPSLSIAYVVFNLAVPELKDIRVRRALNLVYDREVITQKILKLGEPPAYNYVPPGTANYPGGVFMDFRKWPYPQRLAEAQKLMRDAGYSPGNRLRLSYDTTTGPDSRRLAAVFQAMASQIYVNLQIVTSDVPIHYRNLRQRQYQLGAAGWVADFNDASNFLDLLRSDSGNNYTGYANKRFDQMMDMAANEADLKKRGDELAAGERMALADYPWLVTRFAAQTDLVNPRVKGWVENVRGFNPSRWLSIGK